MNFRLRMLIKGTEWKIDHYLKKMEVVEEEKKTYVAPQKSSCDQETRNFSVFFQPNQYFHYFEFPDLPSSKT